MSEQQQGLQPAQEESMECAMCHQTGVALKKCSGCRIERYCSTACQTAAWTEHRAACNRAKKEREKEEAAKAPGSGIGIVSGNGGGLGDMGSIMAALNMPHQQQQQQQRYGEGAIYYACFYDRHDELRKMLLQSGLDIDWAATDGFTAASIAAEKGHDKCLALLISKGANLLKVSKQGYAPIHLACQYGRYTTLALLLDNGVDASLPTADNAYRNTPAIISCIAGHVKLLALLLDRGANPNLQNKYGHTIVHVATQLGQVKCVQLLIKRGANINTRDVDGGTPLDHARQYEQRECENLLLSNHAVGMNVRYISSLNESEKAHQADFAKQAKAAHKGARKCDNPACQTSPDDKSNKRPKKCAACEVALYCCAACQTAHWPAHAILCKELR